MGRRRRCSPSSPPRRPSRCCAGRAGAPCGVLRRRGRVAARRSAAPRCSRSRSRRCRCSTAARADHRGVARRSASAPRWSASPALAVGAARAGPRGRRRCGWRSRPQGALEIAERGAGDRRAHRAGGALRGPARRLRAGGLHLGGVPHLPGAGAGDRRASSATRACMVRRFDEVEDADAWALADVPGSPFAVAVGADGTVLAKGTFNSGAQLESRAGRRRAPPGGRSVPERPLDATEQLAAQHVAARVPLARRRRRDGAGRARKTRRLAGQARRGRGLPLLRAHLHDRLLPAPDRASRGSTRAATRCGRKDGSRVDDLGRLVDRARRPGRRRRQAAAPTPTAGRSRAHRARRSARSSRRSTTSARAIDGAWYRCCGGRVRKLVDCCAYSQPPHQRRRRADGLLLRRPEGVLRHVLPDQGALLMLEAVLLAAGLIAGVTGAWSPCGFSMVDTLAPHGYAGRLRTTLVACATFAAGALAGGVATFGGLALLGRGARRRRGGGDRRGRRGRAGRRRGRGARRADRPAGAPPGARVVAARAAAAARRRALRRPARARLHHLHPLVRRVGAGGRERRARRPGARAARRARLRRSGARCRSSILAPLAGTERGAAAHAAMAERPAILRALRAADAAALAACAAALWAAPAQAASVFAVPGHRPERRRRARRLPGARRAAACIARPGAREPAPGPAPRGRRRAARLDRRRAPSRSARRPTPPTSSRCPRRPPTRSPSPAAGSPGARARAAATRCSPRRCRPPRPRRGAWRRAAPARHARPPRARPATGCCSTSRARRRSRIDQVAARDRPRAPRCAARRARCCSTRPATAGGCSTCARPSSASSCGSARCARAPVRRDRSLYGTVPTGRRDAGHEPGDEHKAHGHPKKLPPRPEPRRRPSRCGAPRSRPAPRS